jgi:F0F1-type ATP synthase assembly protein I
LFFAVKVLVSALIIAGVSELAKRMPSLGGLIAAMPLTTLLALIWLYSETRDYQLALSFTRSVLFAIIPTIFFFITALYLFKRGWPFVVVLLASFGVFAVAALIHQLYLPDSLR